MHLLKSLVAGLVATLALVGCSSDPRSGPETAPLASASNALTPAPAYPLRISANNHYLEDQSGVPFLWVGDSVWSGPTSLTPAEMDQYLDNRSAKGFSIVVVNLLEHKFSKNAPNDAANDPPFTATLPTGVFDLTTPNNAYFSTVEVFFQKAAARGIAVLVAHSYLGYGGGDEGWFSTLKANGATAVRQWGRYVGARYKNQSNVIWLSGGDYTPVDADKWVVDESAQGIRDGGGNQLMTVHTARGENSAVIWGGRSWYNLGSVYYGPPTPLPPLFRAEYARSPVRPTFFVEGRYENVSDWTPDMLRSQGYQPYLTGGMGQMFGNDPVWHAGGPGLGTPAPFTWQQALDQQGSQDMARLASAFAANAWWKLVPDNSHSLLTAGFSSGLAEIVAASATDGSLAMVYVPSTGTGSNSFTLAMNGFVGPVSARWYNPTMGSYSTVAGSPFANSGSQNLSTPGNNGSSTNDWLLVMTASPNAAVLTSITVSPASASVSTNGTQTFAATGYDQSGQLMSPQPSFSWTASGGGNISASGVFTAGSASGGPFTITAASSGKSGTASVTVTASGGSSTLSPVADAYVRDGQYASTNFGGASQLVVKNDVTDWARQSYLKFDLNSLTSSPSTARLRLLGSIAGGEQVPVQVFAVADSTWTEASLTWNARPAAGPSPLAAVTVSGSAGVWYEWDVGAYVRSEYAAGRKVVSFVLQNANRTTNYVPFNSREAASNKPQLVVDAGAGAPPNQPPTVATPAAANPNPVSGSTTALSVLGADDGGEANLTYSWATTGTPPAPVSFSPSTGKSVTASFGKAGTYSIQATIADQLGLTTTSGVNVTVNQTLTTIGVSPGSASVAPNGSRQFSAVASDQFGFSLAAQPSFAWSVGGGGVISTSGLFTAGGTSGGPFTVTAASGGTSGTAAVTVAASGMFTFRALSDAYVRDGVYANNNFGLTTDLQVKTDFADWDRHMYFMFDVSLFTGSATSVKLRLFGSVPTGEQVLVCAYPLADTSWSESTITWNNRPLPGGTELARVTVGSTTGTWFEWDVTSYVNAQKAAGKTLVSFVLLNPGKNKDVPSFASDEASSNRPELVVSQ
jgi:hypothetical protein